MDETILSKLGLNEKEIKIYLYLIKSGVQSVKQIAKMTSINRSTAYRFLESLEEKGLVEWIIGNRGRRVRTASPDNLMLFLKHKKAQFDELEKALPKFISQLDLLKPSEKFETQIRYYKGRQGIEQMIWNSLHAQEITRSYTPLGRRDFINPAFEDEFEREWVRRGLKDQVITNETRIEYIKKKLVPSYKQTLNIRIIPKKKFYITNDIIIYNNTIEIMSLEKDNLIGVEIENPEIAKVQKSIFDIVWEVAKPLSSY